MSYIGNPPVNGVFRKLDTIAASFNGSTTSFNLTSGGAAVSPGLTTNLIISLGGIIQEPNTAYTVNGSVISFTAAPPAGTSFWGIQLGDVGLASTPNQAAMTTQVFTATAGQTTFTVAGGYTPGQIQVLRNGVQLVVGVDVTATNGTTFVLTNAATAGDTLVAVIYTSFIVANAVAKSGDTMSGTLNLPANGLVVGTDQLVAASGNVGIGTSSPGYPLVIRTVGSGTSIGSNIVARLEANGSSRDASLQFSDNVSNSAMISMAGGNLAFSTVGSERARFETGGTLLIGKTAGGLANNGYQINASGTASSVFSLTSVNECFVYNNNNSTGTTYTVSFRQNNSQKGEIAVGASTTAYNTTSDYRLKENIQPMQNALATVALLNPVTYTWKADGSDGQGFIAHELQAVVPDCVTGEKDAVDDEGNPRYQGVDTSFLVATLTKAIQELKAELDDAKARIAALEAKQ